MNHHESGVKGIILLVARKAKPFSFNIYPVLALHHHVALPVETEMSLYYVAYWFVFFVMNVLFAKKVQMSAAVQYGWQGAQCECLLNGWYTCIQSAWYFTRSQSIGAQCIM